MQTIGLRSWFLAVSLTPIFGVVCLAIGIAIAADKPHPDADKTATPAAESADNTVGGGITVV
jgi:hypothetical protein